MRSINRFSASLIFLAAILTAGAAEAGDFTPRCPAPANSTLQTMMRAAPDAVVFEFRGTEARTGIKIYNSLAPRSTDSGDRFYIAMRPGYAFSRLMIASHGCIQTAAVVDLRVAVAIRVALKKVEAELSI